MPSRAELDVIERAICTFGRVKNLDKNKFDFEFRQPLVNTLVERSGFARDIKSLL